VKTSARPAPPRPRRPLPVNGRARLQTGSASAPTTRSAKGAGFRVLIATDGSPGARIALRTALGFPWPAGTQVCAVVASRDLAGVPANGNSSFSFWAGLDDAARRISHAAQRQLAARWPDAGAIVADQWATTAILTTARRTRSDVIVVGSHGHGALARLIVGSVSRAVVRQAAGPVLVAKGRPRKIRRLLLGVDGSPHARRALRLLCRLAPGASGHVTVVRVVEPVRVRSAGLLPAGVRAAVQAQARGLTADWVRAARRDVKGAAARLARAGWRARGLVCLGVPLVELRRAIATERADAIVVGARGHGGLRRLLLGSVAEGTLTRAAVPVLIVR
jgi:nucleotide-binding universal stress UspA family protein